MSGVGVVIMGPLSDGITFHVHAEGCNDQHQPKYQGIRHERWLYDALSFRGVVEEIFADFIFANERQPWTDYESEVRVFPCVGSLPREVAA